MEITIPIPHLSFEAWVGVIYLSGIFVAFFTTAILSRYGICQFDGRGSPPAAAVIFAWPLTIVISSLVIFCILSTSLWCRLANK